MILHTKKKFLRRAFFLTVTIGAIVFAIANIANKPDEQTIAMSGDGDDVELIFDANDKIFYGERRNDADHEWEGDRGATHWFTTATENNGSYTAFCSQPTKAPLAGTFTVEHLNDNDMNLPAATRTKYKMMKLMIFAATNGGPLADSNIQTAATNLMNYLFDSTTLSGLAIYSTTPNRDRLIYAYTHAALGLIYDVDYDGQRATSELRAHESYVRSIVTKLANIVNGSVTAYNDAYVMSQAYNLYTVDRYGAGLENPDRYQDIVWIESPESGRINVEKKDYDIANPQGNAKLSGITFKVFNNSGRRIYDSITHTFYNNGDEMRVAETNAEGKITFVLPIGSFKVQEVTSNSYYYRTVTDPVEAEIIQYRGEDVGLPFKNKVRNGGSIRVRKTDKDSGTCTPSGAAKIAGASFRMYNKSDNPIYYGGRTIPVDGLVDEKTVQTGSCEVIFTGLPYGRYMIMEYNTGNGYLTNMEPQTVTVPVDQEVVITMPNQVMRGNVKFKKVDQNKNNAPMANVAFWITSNTTGEKHIVVSDPNGVVDTSVNAHSNHTNGYDNLVFPDALGSRSYTYNGWGTWFYGNAANSGTVNNSLGALPYDTYTITEVVCTENELCYNIDVPKTFTISSNTTVPVDLGVWYNSCIHPEISTTASDKGDGDKYVKVGSSVTVRDRVTYTDIMPGKTYTIYGYLVDRATGSSLNVTKSVNITPTSASGYVDMDFTFNSSQMAGQGVVVYQELRYNGRTIVEHKEQYNNDQTVYVIDYGTVAVDKLDNDKFIVAEGQVGIKDTINYCLVRGQTFTFTGKLYDKTAGAFLKDSNNRDITSSHTFTPFDACGSVDIEFNFNADGLAGHYIVVYEYLYDSNNRSILPHENPSDAAQTVFLINFGTTAVDKVDGDKYIVADGSVMKVKDTIDYCLVAGYSFTFDGQIFDKTANQLLNVTASTTFVPAAHQQCGSTTIEFNVDTTGLAGHVLVVYEKLYNGSSLIMTHENPNDADQTVFLINFGTTANDKFDGDKYVVAEGDVTIEDTIDYCLIAGQTFKFVGRLYDKTAGEILKDENNNEVRVEATIAPNANNYCSTATIEFTINADELAGHTLVVYEKLYHGGDLIMTHENPNDEDQTVFLINFGTYAFDTADEDKYIIDESSVYIKDTIDYCLVADQTFVFYANLYDKKTDRRLTNANGDLVDYALEVTPSVPCGTATIEFNIDATGLDGRDIVVYEKLYHDGALIMTHEDKDDDDQTVRVISFGTTATDQEDSDKYIIDGEKVTIRDKIKYCLVAGRTFYFEAYLVDDEGNRLKDEKGKDTERHFTLTPAEDCGSIVIQFKVDASELAGHDVVVFERVYDGGHLILTHEDITDRNQTTRTIHLSTFATSNQDELDELDENTDIVITDLVKYCLKANHEFIFIGTLADKDSGETIIINDKPMVQTVRFTPEEDCGEFEITYTFPAKGMAKREFVILEDLYDEDGRRILLREDLDNEDETVRLPDTGFFTEDEGGASTNGGNSNVLIIALGALVAAAVIVIRSFVRVFTGNKRVA